ncbi:MAG: radical SAM protein [Firmicutes bacterium]|nr:radical SAM protein [Bacillota bacterium]
MGYIHSLETMGTDDGGKIRTVVFMQGCNLRCVYCHNPDSWNSAHSAELIQNSEFRIQNEGKESAHSAQRTAHNEGKESAHSAQRTAHNEGNINNNSAPATCNLQPATSKDSTPMPYALCPMPSTELAKKLIRFKPYFKNGGGVTFSGGEPLLQADFVRETVRILKENGIHVALDTACSVLNESVKALYGAVDLVIADLKFFSNEDYITHAHADIFNTVIDTLNYLNKIGKPVILRTVIVQGINDNEESILKYKEIGDRFKNIIRHEFKPFHTMGFSKYKEFGITNPLENKSALSSEVLERLVSAQKSE